MCDLRRYLADKYVTELPFSGVLHQFIDLEEMEYLLHWTADAFPTAPTRARVKKN